MAIRPRPFMSGSSSSLLLPPPPGLAPSLSCLSLPPPPSPLTLLLLLLLLAVELAAAVEGSTGCCVTRGLAGGGSASVHEHTAMLHVYLSSGHVEEAEDLFVEMCEVLPASFAPLFLVC